MIKINLGDNSYYSLQSASQLVRRLFSMGDIDRYEMKEKSVMIFKGDKTGSIEPIDSKDGLIIFSEISLRNWV